MPDVQATVCMLDISRLVLIIGREIALSIGCSAQLEALVTKKLSRAVCTISRIALVARMTSAVPAAAQSAQPHTNMYEDHLLLSNDLRALSVVLSRAAVELSRRIVAAADAQAQAIVSDLCFLSRSASMKSTAALAAVNCSLCDAAVSCLERFENVLPASIVG